MKKIYSLLLILALSQIVFGQEFSFQMYFQDSAGNKDTLTIGYDVNATDSIDAIFGETNIISTPLSPGLDVRVTNEWLKRQYYFLWFIIIRAHNPKAIAVMFFNIVIAGNCKFFIGYLQAFQPV